MSSYGNEPPPNPYGQNPPQGPPPGGPPQGPPPGGPSQSPPPPPQQGGQYGGQYGAPAYGQGAPGGYGAAPGGYGGPPGYGGVPSYQYASWFQRVGGYLIDGLLALLAGIPLWIGYGILIASASSGTTTYDPNTGSFETTGGSDGGSAVGIVLVLLGIATYFAFIVWNLFIKQGRTGYSIGKGVMGIKLVEEATGQPIGAGKAFVRQLCHILDGFCYIGFLWPLWDAKRQTFADKIMTTVVFNSPKP